jgi:putative NIF3 family GTP cyclohydrolase 1 type 2
VTVQDFQDYVIRLKREAGLPATFNEDEGLVLGRPEAEIRAILVAWMGTLDALEMAAREHCNLVVVHEQFYFYSFWSAEKLRPQDLTWRANRRRIEMAERHGMSVLRLHGTMDMLHNFEDFAALIGCDVGPRGGGYYRVFPVPETTVGELVTRLKRLLKLDHVRMVGDPRRRVRCLGLPMGGLCLDSNISYMEWCIEHGADCLIGGEADEYGFLLAADADIPCIETGHFVSETPGVLNFARRLQESFPDVKVVGYDARRPFVYA